MIDPRHFYITWPCSISLTGLYFSWILACFSNSKGIVSQNLCFSCEELLLHNLCENNFRPANRTCQWLLVLFCKLLKHGEASIMQHVRPVTGKDHHAFTRLKLERADWATRTNHGGSKLLGRYLVTALDLGLPLRDHFDARLLDTEFSVIIMVAHSTPTSTIPCF